jgi:hypothetical protein
MRMHTTARAGLIAAALLFTTPTAARAALELEPLPGAAGSGAISLTFSPDGRHVAGVVAGTGQIAIFDVDGATLTQTAGSPFDAGVRQAPGVLAYSPDGTLLAAETPDENGNNNVATVVYHVASNGALAGTAATQAPGDSIGFSPDGKLLAVAGSDEISVYSVQPGGGLVLSGAAAVSNIGARGVAFSRDSTRLVVPDAFGGVYGFAVSAVGALTALPASPAPFPTRYIAGGIATDRLDGRLVISSGRGAIGLAMFSMDPASGALTEAPAGFSPFGVNPGSGREMIPPSVSADGRVIAATAWYGSSLGLYSVTSGGPLVPAIGNPFAGYAQSVAVSPDGSLLAHSIGDSDGVSLASTAMPPAVHCAPAPTGWQAGNVTVSCTASDGGSGLADPSQASFSLSTSVAAGTEDAHASASRQVCDVAGNCASAAPQAMVDRKAPSIAVWAPANGGNYSAVLTLLFPVKVAYSCSDGGSGVASCAGTQPSGATLDTSLGAIGTHSFTVTTTDKVGNLATRTVTYKVSILGVLI